MERKPRLLRISQIGSNGREPQRLWRTRSFGHTDDHQQFGQLVHGRIDAQQWSANHDCCGSLRSDQTVASLNAYGVRDLSGTLTTINNSGNWFTAASTLSNGAQTTIAADLSDRIKRSRASTLMAYAIFRAH